MHLTIVTPTLGTSPWLDETVRSCRSIADCTHILVAPHHLVDALRTEYPDLEVIGERRPGMYAALNSALGAVPKSGCFTWINDDDLIIAKGIEAARAVLVDCAECAIVYGQVSMIAEDGRFLARIPVAMDERDLMPLLAIGKIPLAQPGTLMRAAVIERIGPFDETLKLAGDLDYFRRLLLAGVKFRYLNKQLACFRLQRDQLSKLDEVARMEKAEVLKGLKVNRVSVAIAWLRFLVCNIPVYRQRLGSHGAVSMEAMYKKH